MLQIVLLLYYAPNTIPRTYVISDLTGEEIVGTFYKKELQKQMKKSLESKNLQREKLINYILNGIAIIILLTVGQIKKTQYK